MALGMQVGLGPCHIVLDGDPARPTKKGAEPPIFGPCLLWPNGWMDQDDTWHGGGPRSRPHCARWGPSSPPPKGDRASPISPYVYCGQTAEWVKMPLGTEIGVGPGDIVLDGDPVPPPKKGGGQHIPPPFFGACLLWPNGCISGYHLVRW